MNKFYLQTPAGPTQREFFTNSEGVLEKFHKNYPYFYPEQFFNNHFFQIREDYLNSLRKQFFGMVRNNNLFSEKNSEVTKALFLYINLTLLDVNFSIQNGIQLKIRMAPSNFQNGQINIVDWSQTNRLKKGHLFLITNHYFQNIIFCLIEQDAKIDSSLEDNHYVIATLTILTQYERQNVTNILHLFMNSLTGIAVESKIYCQTYLNYLEAIKNINIELFPFKNNIIQYRKDKLKIDDPIYYNIEGLDESQSDAIKFIFNNKVAVIKGPPGTGKTYCGAVAVREIIKHLDKQDAPIMIVCYTNHALDQFLLEILGMKFMDEKDIARLGNRSNEKLIQKLTYKTWNSCKEYKGELANIQKDIEQEIQEVFKPNISQRYTQCQLFFPELLEYVVNDFLQKLGYESLDTFHGDTIQKIFELWADMTYPTKFNSYLSLFKILKKERNKIKPSDEPQEFIKEIYLNSEQKENQTLKFQDKQQIRKTVNQQELSSTQVDESSQQLTEQKLQVLEENTPQQKEKQENEQIDYIEMNEQKNKKDNDENFVKIQWAISDQDITLQDLMNQIINNNLNLWDYLRVDRTFILNKILFSSQKLHTIEINSLYGKYLEEKKILDDKMANSDKKQLKQKKIIALTVNGCAIFSKIIQKLKPKVMVIEEAAEVLESFNIAILNPSLEHLILIGDEMQLVPKVANQDLNGKYKYNYSLFERLLIQDLPYRLLKHQRRMKSKFSSYTRLFYNQNGKENFYYDHQSILEQNKIPINGVLTDLLFFDHNDEEIYDEETSSYKNKLEADMILNFVRYLLLNKYKITQITVISMYSGQTVNINGQLKAYDIPLELRVCSVDNYQGEENDIILISMVRSNQQGNIGFLTNENRLNVSLSRAKLGMYIFGNFDCIREACNKKNSNKSEMWLKVIQKATKDEVLSNFLGIKCEVHKVDTQIKVPSDWNPLGSCQTNCIDKCECGHQCKRKCHFQDKYHKQKYCLTKCEKKLGCGHPCQGLCSETPCPKCKIRIKKQLPCQHFKQMYCHYKQSDFKCFETCQKKLNCGHECSKCCFEVCPPCSNISCKKLKIPDRII